MSRIGIVLLVCIGLVAPSALAVENQVDPVVNDAATAPSGTDEPENEAETEPSVEDMTAQRSEAEATAEASEEAAPGTSSTEVAIEEKEDVSKSQDAEVERLRSVRAELRRGAPYGPSKPKAGKRGSFGSSGTVVLSAEQLFGFQATSLSIGELEAKSSGLFLFGGGIRSFVTSPRLAVDVFAGRVFTLGASTTLTVQDGEVGWSFLPRIGVYLGSEKIALWPRLGVSLFNGFVDSADGKLKSTNLSAEALVMIRMIDRVSFHLGPSFHFPLGGKVKSGDTEADLKLRSLGATFGLSIAL